MDSDRAVLWTVAVAASLGLHVLIVVALLGFGAISGPSSPSREPEPKAPVLTSDSGTVPTKPELPPLGTVPTRLVNPPPVATAPDRPASPVQAGTVPNVHAGTVPNGDKFYVVKAGDNLSKIAKLDDSTIAELAELNGKTIKERSRLMVGQKIKVKNGIK